VRLDLPKLRQGLGVAVTSLLVADLAALGVLLAADGPGFAAPAEAAAPAPRHMAVISLPDGRRFLADPATVEGQRAIDEALAGGGSVRNITVAVPARGGSGSGVRTPFTIPGGGGTLPIPVGSDLEELIDSILTPVLTVTVPGSGGTTVGEVAAPLTDLLDDTSSTLGSLLGSAPSTVASVAGDPSGSVGSIAGSATTLLETVTTLVPVTVLPAPATTTTTTTPPTPTSTICSLLVICD
jgi:hypothetical protein